MTHGIMGNRAAFGRKPAWHGRGHVKKEGLYSFDELFKAAGLDYEVEKVPAYWPEPRPSEDGTPGVLFTKAPGCFLTVARWPDSAPTVLGQVGADYQVVQNSEAFALFAPLMDRGELLFDTGGVLWGGRVVWVMAEVPDLVWDGGGDPVKGFILFTNSHDGSSCVQAALVTVRVVCANTRRVALASALTSARIRHTVSAADRLAEAAKAMGLARAGFEKEARAYDRMRAKRITSDETWEYVDRVLAIDPGAAVSGRKRNERAVIHSCICGDGVADIRTVWAAYNGVTQFADHSKKAKDRVASIWFGTGAKLKDRAFELAMELAGA